MNEYLDKMVSEVKLAKAENAFSESLKVYGSMVNCLRAYDCNSKEEAVKMLAVVQKVSIGKVDGKIVVS